MEIAGERGVAASVALLLQHAEQPTAVPASTVPVPEHGVPPRVKQAALGIGPALAFGKHLVAQVAEHARAADAEVAGDRLRRPSFTFQGSHHKSIV